MEQFSSQSTDRQGQQLAEMAADLARFWAIIEEMLLSIYAHGFDVVLLDNLREYTRNFRALAPERSDKLRSGIVVYGIYGPIYDLFLEVENTEEEAYGAIFRVCDSQEPDDLESAIFSSLYCKSHADEALAMLPILRRQHPANHPIQLKTLDDPGLSQGNGHQIDESPSTVQIPAQESSYSSGKRRRGNLVWVASVVIVVLAVLSYGVFIDRMDNDQSLDLIGSQAAPPTPVPSLAPNVMPNLERQTPPTRVPTPRPTAVPKLPSNLSLNTRIPLPTTVTNFSSGGFTPELVRACEHFQNEVRKASNQGFSDAQIVAALSMYFTLEEIESGASMCSVVLESHSSR